MEDDKIRIFDVIVSVNDKSADTLLSTSVYKKEPQKCFDSHLESKTNIKLIVNRSMSLPPISNTLGFGTSLLIAAHDDIMCNNNCLNIK